METNQSHGNRVIRKLLSVAISLRIINDTGVQIFFPFLPVLAAGVGVSVAVMGQLLAIRTLTGLVAPLLGVLAERRGYRQVMHGGLLLLGSGLIIFATSTQLAIVILSLILMGIGINAFVPNLFAYTSQQIPPEIRSRGLGSLELAWATASIVGMYLIGQGFLRLGWRETVIILGSITIVASFLIRTLPALQERANRGERKQFNLRRSLSTSFDWGPHRRSAWAMHLATFLTSFAAIHLFGAYGEWLFSDFEFNAGQIGTVALALDISDFIFNSLISIFGDRIGPLRSLQFGTPIAATLAFSLIWLDNALVTLIVGLIFARFFTEFVYVNALIVASGQLPEYRARMMTLNSAFSTLGIAVANISGPAAFLAFGPVGLALPTMIGYGVATILFVQVIREHVPAPGVVHG